MAVDYKQSWMTESTNNELFKCRGEIKQFKDQCRLQCSYS